MMNVDDDDAVTFQVVRKVGQDKLSTYILEEQQYLVAQANSGQVLGMILEKSGE